METNKDRLMKFIVYLNISTRKFEREIGVSLSTLAHTSDNLTFAIIEKTAQRYPEINKDWLRSGEGEMILRGDKSTVTGNSIAADGNSGIVAVGAKNFTQSGTDENVSRALDILASQLNKKDEQIDRLLKILEK